MSRGVRDGEDFCELQKIISNLRRLIFYLKWELYFNVLFQFSILWTSFNVLYFLLY